MSNKSFTPEQVADLTKQHGKLIHVRVFLDEEKKEVRECLVKDPTGLPDLSFIAACMEYENVIKRGEYILDNLWVDGHEDFRINQATLKSNNTEVRLAGIIPVNKALKFLEAEVVKH